jgi:uncharacterized protein YndB with AHSA1/START domain
MTEGRTDCAVRFLRAKPEAVYRAFVEPEALLAWLPPPGMRGEMLYFDARPGGGYRMRLTYVDGGEGKSSADSDLVEVRFEALEPRRRIVQSAEFDSDDPAFAGTMQMTWSFDRYDAGTRVTIICRNVPPGIDRAEHDAGLQGSLANLARLVER